MAILQSTSVSGSLSVTGSVATTEPTIMDSTLSVSGDVSIADKIIHTGDTNTAIRFPANDTISFETAGGEAARIDSSGNVGIGVTNPNNKLDAVAAVGGNYGTSTQQVVARFLNFPASLGSGVNSAFISLQTTANAGAHNPIARIGVVGESFASNNGSFVVATRDGSGISERMRIDSSGNVGIGTTSVNAQVKLAVVGGDMTSSENIAIQTTDASTYTIGRRRNPEENIHTGINFIKGDGGGNYDYIMAFVNTASTGGSATERMRITNTGNVGIGTTSPSASVHVQNSSNDNIIAAIGETGYEGVLYLSGDGSGKDASIVIGNNRVLKFKTTATATPTSSGTEVMRVSPNGYLRMASGSGGIQFNGDIAAANALNDYEEGTWTATVSGGTFTNLSTGKYTKIGNQVFVTLNPATTAITGNLTFSGLPFTASSRSALVNAAVPPSGPSGVTYLPKLIDGTDMSVDVSGSYSGSSVSSYFAAAYFV